MSANHWLILCNDAAETGHIIVAIPARPSKNVDEDNIDDYENYRLRIMRFVNANIMSVDKPAVSSLEEKDEDTLLSPVQIVFILLDFHFLCA